MTSRTSDYGRRHLTDICLSMYGVNTQVIITKREMQYEKCHFCNMAITNIAAKQRQLSGQLTTVMGIQVLFTHKVVSNLVHVNTTVVV